jgi:hypothetical protein
MPAVRANLARPIWMKYRCIRTPQRSSGINPEGAPRQHRQTEALRRIGLLLEVLPRKALEALN